MEETIIKETGKLLPYFLKHKNVWSNYKKTSEICKTKKVFCGLSLLYAFQKSFLVSKELLEKEEEPGLCKIYKNCMEYASGRPSTNWQIV